MKYYVRYRMKDSQEPTTCVRDVFGGQGLDTLCGMDLSDAKYVDTESISYPARAGEVCRSCLSAIQRITRLPSHIKAKAKRKQSCP